jgi:hypothetical protein
MARQMLAVALALTCALPALGAGPEEPVHAETLLQIDYGWRTDGKLACTPAFIESAPWRRMACVDPIWELENFAQTMDTQFSSNTPCHGITLFRFPWGPMPIEKSAEVSKRPHWMFFVYVYKPGDEKQSWRLTDPDRKSVFAGEGNPKEIVQGVCGVVVGKGGSVMR